MNYDYEDDEEGWEGDFYPDKDLPTFGTMLFWVLMTPVFILINLYYRRKRSPHA